MNYKIRCNGQAGGKFFYLHISRDGQISLKKTLAEGSSFIKATLGEHRQTFYAQGTKWYLGWDLSTASPKVYEAPISEAVWFSQLGSNPSPMRGYTSQKPMFLDGLTLTGGVQIVDRVDDPYTGTRWTAEPDFGI